MVYMRPKLNKEQFLAKMAEGREARRYVNQIIKEHGHKEGEFNTSGLWQKSIVDQLKQKSLTFNGNVLKYLIDGKMGGFTTWLIGELQEALLEQYKQADEFTKSAFKKKMEEYFTHTGLTRSL